MTKLRRKRRRDKIKKFIASLVAVIMLITLVLNIQHGLTLSVIIPTIYISVFIIWYGSNYGKHRN